MDQNPYTTSSTPVIPQNGADIDSLDVSDRWKQFFKGVQKWGGLQMPLYKALPKGPQRREALKDVKPPIASFALAFVFGFFYYLAKGMWNHLLQPVIYNAYPCRRGESTIQLGYPLP